MPQVNKFDSMFFKRQNKSLFEFRQFRAVYIRQFIFDTAPKKKFEFWDIEKIAFDL